MSLLLLFNQGGGGSGGTHNADATLTASGSLAATATQDTSTTATLAATGTLAAAGERTQAATATLNATGELTSTGVRAQDTTATLAATGALAGSGLRSTDATATLAATGTLTADGEIPGQLQHVFTDQTPTITDASDGTPGITFGTTIRSAVDGYVTGVRWYTTTTTSGTYIGALYEVTAADDPTPAGTELAQKTLVGSPTSSGWNSITFDSPVPITAGVLYRAAVHSSAGRYVYSANVHNSDITNGDLIADAAGDDPVGLGTLRQATFTISAGLAYPATGAGSNGSYFADWDFVADALPVEGSATLAATGGLTAAGDRTAVATVTLSGSGSLAAAADRSQFADTTLSGTGTLNATAALAAADAATLSASGALAATAARETSDTATLSVQGALTAASTVERVTLATFAGTAALAAIGEVANEQAATLAASASLTASATIAHSTAGTFAAVGSLTAEAGSSVSATAVLAGTGTLSAATVTRRQPGRYTTGSTRPRITAGSVRAGTYRTGGVDG
ncbi:hypothetical protein FHR83_006706 [Actinoplanes campanulatus]|uniref:DUF4082 domain-containing protein n=1 Tax=Actinoplanes campanulatus TaxID=113559 RepID=A0A7W5AMR9_9ACTN|nr:DUF4082 domain-containing protein [Actinoplanes campanulatus]MBB3099000.1 hypothetical protein [Actinoplanes campanulatus]GGN39505.1 hypothetical protein GCM10010109_67500 [Actinoplanes campanulatus]GID40160.1 hypothetical protein Aca09nite_66660 [Actinoplanes campanulatus]